MVIIVFPLAWNEYVWKSPDVKMFPYEAMISPHIQYIKKHGAIYFDANWRNWNQILNLRTPITGYIYIGKKVPDAPQNMLGKIGYRVKIEKILSRDQLINQIKREYKYIPFWRQQCLDGKWPLGSPYAGLPHEPSRIWLKLTDIKELVQPLDLSEIGRTVIRYGIVIEEDRIEDKDLELRNVEIDVNDTKQYQLKTYKR